MKKIIRLNEQDLLRIVRRVINEGNPKVVLTQGMSFRCTPEEDCLNTIKGNIKFDKDKFKSFENPTVYKFTSTDELPEILKKFKVNFKEFSQYNNYKENESPKGNDIVLLGDLD